MWIPTSNGVKNLYDFLPFTYYETDWRRKKPLADKLKERPIVMYDQEPLFVSAVDIYRSIMRDSTECDLHQLIDQAYMPDIVATGRMRTSGIPIWCHSELNSLEIENMESRLFVPCYYWYHAMIARDWFRHWQYNSLVQPKNNSKAPYRFLLYARDFSGSRIYRSRLLQDLDPLRTSIKHDWLRTKNISSDHSAKIDLEDASSCAIHLVAETLFDTGKIHLTEKIFKPIVMSQPFLIWAPPGSLKYLKSYGFRTFSSVWSEDYDEQTDHDKRHAMLIALVESINRLDDDSFSSLYEKCLPIIQHNREWFFHYINDVAWKELVDNFGRAMSRRQELERENPGGQICYVLGTNHDLWNIPSNRVPIQHVMRDMDQQELYRLLIRYPQFSELR